ncbi:hypothetical protein DL96DRAFT_1648344 [Flagelloscypha sp. PMI_526]|nr:hypothetical protein DL96DRAFT_1648344 [Flagelloscypha sp. PMI_526]
MGFLRTVTGSLKSADDTLGFVQHRLRRNKARSFPPLPVDVARIICEFAAYLDKKTARNISILSKDVRGWVAPILFQHIKICSYQSFMRLKSPDIMEHVAPFVSAVSLDPVAGDRLPGECEQMSTDLNKFLEALPRLTHFHRARSIGYSRWAGIDLTLPDCISSLQIGQSFLQLEHTKCNALPCVSRCYVTHMMSSLMAPVSPSVFTNWPSLTHILFEISNCHTLCSIVDSTFPTDILPTSIVSCILVDSQSSACQFCWFIDQAFVDLVLGNTDARIVFSAGGSRESWMLLDGPRKYLETSPTQDLTWIREGLRDAILFHDSSKNVPPDSIWEEAEVIRRRRDDMLVRKAVYKLLDHSVSV